MFCEPTVTKSDSRESLKHHTTASDGETSSFSTEGHTTSIEDDCLFAEEYDLPQARGRQRSHSFMEDEDGLGSNSGSDLGVSPPFPMFEGFTEDSGTDEEEIPQTRGRTRSRYGVEDASILGINLVNSPPPPPSPLDGDESKKSPSQLRTGPLRVEQLRALEAGVKDATIRLPDEQIAEEEEEKMLAEVERAQSVSNIQPLWPQNPSMKKIKLLLLGDSGVGKSSLLRRWVDDIFHVSLVGTIGVDFKGKKSRIGQEEVQVQVWDTAGQEKFHRITTAYYRGAHGILLVYDVTSQSSLENISYWMESIRKNAHQKVTVALIGNKVDMREPASGRGRAISTHDGQKAANGCNVPYFETSAKTGEGVEFAFTSVAQQVAQAIFPEGQANFGPSPNTPKNKKKARKRLSSDKCTVA